MGRHTASTGKNGAAAPNAAVTASPTESLSVDNGLVEKSLARKDGWWVVGFGLGIVMGGLSAYATFLWWLSGGMEEFISNLF